MTALTVLLAVTASLMVAKRSMAAKEGSRTLGLVLQESCNTESYPCLVTGTVCVAPAGSTDGICQCRPNFKQYGFPGWGPDFRCVPTKMVPLNETECEINSDCDEIGSANCRQGSPRNTCQCKSDFVYDPVLLTCKEVYCGGKPGNFCSDPTRLGSIAGSTCSSVATNSGRCVCTAPQKLTTWVSGLSSCIDPNNITCRTEQELCPPVSYGQSICLPNDGISGLGKCGCQVNSLVAGAITVDYYGNLQCGPNQMGGSCQNNFDCPPSASCIKKKSAGVNVRGMCGCASFQKPSSDNMRCEWTMGLRCRRDSECGLGPVPTATEKPFKCVKANPTDPNANGLCTCPMGSGWNGTTCVVQTGPGMACNCCHKCPGMYAR